MQTPLMQFPYCFSIILCCVAVCANCWWNTIALMPVLILHRLLVFYEATVCFPSTLPVIWSSFCHFIQGSFSALFSVSIVACMWYAYVLWEYFFYNCLRTQRSSLKLISIVETRSLVVNFFLWAQCNENEKWFVCELMWPNEGMYWVFRIEYFWILHKEQSVGIKTKFLRKPIK